MEKVEMNKDMKLSELYGLRLSPHFTLGEMTKTNHKTAGSHWIHFAVRPTGNRRKTDILKV